MEKGDKCDVYILNDFSIRKTHSFCIGGGLVRGMNVFVPLFDSNEPHKSSGTSEEYNSDSDEWLL